MQKNKMIPVLLSRRSYSQRILSLGPIRYWPMWSPSGTSAVELVAGDNGTHSNVTLGVMGIGDGRTAASYNGTTSYTNVYSAALASAFSATSLTISVWVKAVYDSATRYAVQFGANANNRAAVIIETNNNVYGYYIAGGTAKNAYGSPAGDANFYNLIFTVDKAGDAIKIYKNNVQIGSTGTGLGTWSGSLASGFCQIGSYNLTPSNPWSGSIGHVVLWNRVITASERAIVAKV